MASKVLSAFIGVSLMVSSSMAIAQQGPSETRTQRERGIGIGGDRVTERVVGVSFLFFLLAVGILSAKNGRNTILPKPPAPPVSP